VVAPTLFVKTCSMFETMIDAGRYNTNRRYIYYSTPSSC